MTLEKQKMKTLTIRWQRLVDISGQTCTRCKETGGAAETAFGLAADRLKNGSERLSAKSRAAMFAETQNVER
jgi:hypothetical protein